jgi:hypothetical protein
VAVKTKNINTYMRASRNNTLPLSAVTVGDPFNPPLIVPSPPARSGRRWLIAALAGLAGLVQSAQAQIGVPAGGVGPLTFDTLPPVTEAATYVLNGTATTYQNVAALEAGVQTINQSVVQRVLPQSATQPPSTFSGGFRHNNGGFYIQSRPTTDGTNAAGVLKVTLRNDIGSTATQLTIQYDQGMFNQQAAGTDELPGMYVYYSVSGEPGTWVNIPALSAVDAAQAVSATVDLSSTPWPANAPLYLLWVDDNDDGQTDTSYTIDNLSLFATGGDVPVSLTIQTPTANQQINQSVNFNVTTLALGPISGVGFFINGSFYSSDLQAPFTAVLSGLAPGNYNLTAFATNANTGAVVAAVNNPVPFTIIANQPPFIQITNPPQPFSVLVGTAVTNQVVATDDVAVVRVEWYLDSQLVYSRSNANWSYCYNNSLVGTHTIYAVAFDAAGASTQSDPISVTVTNPLPAQYTIVLPNGSLWNYYISSNEPPRLGDPEFGIQWNEFNYDPAQVPGWLTGNGELGGGDNSLNPGDAFYPERTVIDIGPGVNPPGRHRAAYFLSDLFFWPDDIEAHTGGVVIRLLRDDGAVVYLNTFPIFTNNMPDPLPLPVPYATLATAAAGDDGTVYQELLIPHSKFGELGIGQGAFAWLAVEVHQSSATSSDLSYDLMVWAVRSPTPTVTITSPTNGASFAQGNPVTVNVASSVFAESVVFYVDGNEVGTDPDRSATLPNHTFTIPGIQGLGQHTLTVVGVAGESGIRSTSAPVVINIFYAGDPVVTFGSTWLYLDDGSDQGTAWRERGFADGGWASGPAPLGYPAGTALGIVTVVSFGPEATNKYPTTYFRKHVNLASVAGISNAVLTLKRDDGGVVYINGTEVFRVNMPAGDINYLTYASSTTNGTNTTCIPPSVLVQGDNVIAVEIHQGNATSSDIQMDLALTLNPPPTGPPTVSITSPTNGATLLAGPVPITATAADPDCGVGSVEFFVDGVSIGTDTTAPYAVTWDATAGNHTLTARVRSTAGAVADSAPVAVTVLPGPDRLVLVNTNSVWKYLDDGSDPGTAWRAKIYDDNAWPSGPAELGFGDNDEATVVRQTNEVTGATNIAVFFRHYFNSPNPAPMTNLLIRLRRDDGGVVYINGVEVFRSNMPGGEITYQTFAAGGTTSETAFFETNVSPSVLEAGLNTVAVSVHQNTITSSDLSFEFQLIAEGPPGSLPTDLVKIALVDHDSDPGTPAIVEVSWDKDGATLIQSSDVTAPLSTWTVVPGVVGKTYRPSPLGTQMFYALRTP